MNLQRASGGEIRLKYIDIHYFSKQEDEEEIGLNSGLNASGVVRKRGFSCVLQRRRRRCL